MCDYTRGNSGSRCFYRRTYTTSLLVFPQQPSRWRHPTPSLLSSRQTACLRLFDRTVLWNFWARDFLSLYSPLAALPSLTATPAPASPTRTVWRPLYQKSILLLILTLIFLALWSPNVLSGYYGENEGFLGVTTTVKNTLPFHGQDFHEPALYCSIGCGILDNQLHSQPAPTALSNSVV